MPQDALPSERRFATRGVGLAPPFPVLAVSRHALSRRAPFRIMLSARSCPEVLHCPPFTEHPPLGGEGIRAARRTRRKLCGLPGIPVFEAPRSPRGGVPPGSQACRGGCLQGGRWPRRSIQMSNLKIKNKNPNQSTNNGFSSDKKQHIFVIR